MVKNFLWDMAGRAGAQAVSLFCSFLLTRLLDPVDFGVAGIAISWLIIVTIILDLGFSRALIQRKESGEDEFASVFTLQLIAGCFLTLVTCLLAGPLADFYHFPKLRPVLQLVSVYFILYALTTVPLAMLTRKMAFKKIAMSSFISAVLSGVIAILIARNGAGVWSIVIQYILLVMLNALMVFFFSGWRPRLKLKRASLLSLWKYGSLMFYANLLFTIVSRLDIFIIGKLFSPLLLGYYSRAQTIDGFTRTFTTASFSSVFFTAVAKLQDQRDQLMQLYKRYLHFVSFLTVGLSGLLYLVTPDLFRLLFTEKWDMAGAYFQVMCVAAFAWPISSLMVNLIAGIGNAKTYLTVELLRLILLVPIYFFGFRNDIETFLWIMVIFRMISICYNAYFVSKEIQFPATRQLGIIFMYTLQGLLATGATLLIFRFFDPGGSILRLITMVIIYSIIYLVSQALMKTHAFRELLNFYRKLGDTRTQAG